VKSLAAASEQEILRMWQGLGYYTRARNLHLCAKEVSSRFNGIFPTSYAELIQLPGIGEYTAAAIASFSSSEPVAVVDGNVFRILARIFGIETEINSPRGKKQFTELANRLIDPAAPDTHNQAVMEFGALFCTPKAPQCPECIFKSSCIAFRDKTQNLLPVKIKGKKARKRYFYYFVLRQGNNLLMKKRESKDIWHGLYDFVLIEKKRTTKAEPLLNELSLLKKARKNPIVSVSKVYRHVLSHQTIDAKFIVASLDSVADLQEPDELKFYSRKKIEELPKPVLISKFLDDYDWQ
jgi:A/G-specific adenine glycosylase